MVVAVAAGATGAQLFSTDIYGSGQTFTSAMMATRGTDQVAGGGGAEAALVFNSLFFLGLLLFIITLGLNMLGNAFVNRVRNKY